ncbi:MAG: hypothetical protein ABTQ26_11850 [Azonexus sp.]
MPRKQAHVILTTPDIVVDCVQKLPVESFTTCEVADALMASGNFSGVEYERLERSVRQSVAWLIDRGMAQAAGARKKITKAGHISWPVTYTIIRLSALPKPQPIECGPVDFEALNRAFLR